MAKNEPSGPTLPTIKRLYAVSGNVCAYPGCTYPLVDETSGTVISEICHIKGYRPGVGNRRGAARHDRNQTASQRHDFDNLILMCSNHHEIIDNDENTWTVARLKQLKAKHEKAHKGGTKPSDDIAKQFQLTVTNGSVIIAPNQQGGQIAHNITNNNVVNHNVTNSVSGFDKIFQSRDDLRGIQTVAQTIGSLLNAGDPYWTRTISSDGSVTLAANSPEAHKIRPLTLRMQTQVFAPDDKPVSERLLHATDHTEGFTLNKGELLGLQTFLGDTLIEDVHDILQHLTVSITPASLGPILNCSLRVKGVGVELPHLKVGLYAVPGGRLRFTNRLDDDAPTIISINFPWQPSDEDKGAGAITLSEATMTIGAKATPGRTMRHLIELYALIRALATPRTLELYEPATSDIHFVTTGATVAVLPSDQDAFIDAMEAVQDVFPMTRFPMPSSITKGEVRNIFEIADIMRTGQSAKSIKSAAGSMDAKTINNVLEYVDKSGVLQSVDENEVKHENKMELRCETTTYELLGQPINLGPSRQYYCPLKLAILPATLRRKTARLSPGDLLEVKFKPANPSNDKVTIHYPDFGKAHVE